MSYRWQFWVPGPQSLWHIDGHHALIRGHLVTHVGIDGYSRMIVCLKCSDNKRATTVAAQFATACDHFSLPEKVRSDHGGEHQGARDIMQSRRGNGSFMAGTSVHNSLIERLWRDEHYGVTHTFYSLFYHLEGTGDLYAENDLDIFALHMVYLPIINNCLCKFRGAYNAHPL